MRRFTTEFTCHLDRSGYIRFRRWCFYAEEGLARQEVQMSIFLYHRAALFSWSDLARTAHRHVDGQ